MQINETWKKIFNKSRQTLLMLISVLLIFSLIFWVYAEIQGNAGIQRTVREIKANSTDQETLVNNLLKWERDNVGFSYAPLTGNINIDKIPRLIYSTRPYLIFYNKLGACGEFSSLFMEMAKAAGIQTRIAGTIGEDHQWNEVLINKTWVHVDPTLDNSSNFDNPHFYENKWKWNLSKVYAFYNGEQIDVTETYFEKIGYLNVSVIEKTIPVENIEVIISSQFRMEKDPDFYKAPLQTTQCTTGLNGTCSFYLGEGNYTILVRKGDLPFRLSPYLLEFEQKNITLIANLTKELVFSFPETKLDTLSGMVYLMIGYAFIIGYFVKVKPDLRKSKNTLETIRKALQGIKEHFKRHN